MLVKCDPDDNRTTTLKGRVFVESETKNAARKVRTAHTENTTASAELGLARVKEKRARERDRSHFVHEKKEKTRMRTRKDDFNCSRRSFMEKTAKGLGGLGDPDEDFYN